ncbi:phosphoethanolamine--lipid A transferase [Roseateles asaccharophilus]|uniref:Glucan phosphoethanolaminetransferase (Alkaline phosphatase superfamily)/membrane-associated PAP2 superfamily phosphatase n=1 Tax=Roseateles asaccharophilus TaxID=582607 RepID=A0ABU2A3L8_9BURK|nr:phosphoethanolamine--lipid A transferase [Roseateles asaccharophilus]MDR7331625.1 glucan phosphoethanolaminetransferase (alkaline phosphatase superfamily)/membrane-associated PAP2 superfamily phosphatase [Roseateles asaccharophilus]
MLVVSPSLSHLPARRSWRLESLGTWLSLGVLLLWDASGLDLRFARYWGDAGGFAWREHWLTAGVLHEGGRALAWVVVALLVVNVVRPLWRLQSRRERVWWLAVTLACVALIALLKRASTTSCPWDLTEFGGVARHLSHWRLGVADGGGGHCFPSGHASAAFAFLGGYFALRRAYPRQARAWLAGVLLAGALFGGAQLARGAHFPSHTLWTAWICWAVTWLAWGVSTGPARPDVTRALTDARRRLPDWLRPQASQPLTQAWLAALWMGLLANWPLWLKLHGMAEVRPLFIVAFAGMVTAATGAVLSVLAWPRLIRGVLPVLLLASGALAHFIGSYGIVFDAAMVTNLLQTDWHETRDLLSWRLLLSVALLGGLPSWWLLRRPAAPPQALRRQLAHNVAAFALAVVVMAVLALGVFADLSSTMRNDKTLRYRVTPLNAVYSLGSAALRAQAGPVGPPAVIGADAHLLPRAPGAKPPLLLLVVGETARAMNFSLNGYARPTNPALARLPVVSLRDVTSCGTATAASLPCMFSPLGREAFGAQKQPQENLLDVLQRAGLAVLWLDNQSGCKGLCDRVPNAFTRQLPAGAVPLPAGLCDGDECQDEALLHELDRRVAALDPMRLQRGLVLVMHQMGSHGPAYFKRSPPDLKPFQPECRSNALQQCAREAVVNGYDNSIVSTDRLLAHAVSWLQTQRGFDPGLLYVSDHGESLGENGLYLHGMPYAFAPREQTHVPMVLWLPEQGDLAASLKPGCLGGLRDRPTSHDQLFHTVMGWVGARADVYQPARDLLAGCRA